MRRSGACSPSTGSRLEAALDPAGPGRLRTSHDHIAEENPEAAGRIAQRIRDATETLLEYPRIGRVGEDEDSREWHVDKTPYLLIYSIKGDVIELWRVWHESQDPSTR